jgi:hypothetical protein
VSSLRLRVLSSLFDRSRVCSASALRFLSSLFAGSRFCSASVLWLLCVSSVFLEFALRLLCVCCYSCFCVLRRVFIASAPKQTFPSHLSTSSFILHRPESSCKMAAACKDTRAKGPFGLWLFTKHPVSAVDDSLQESPSDFTVSDSSASDPAAAREAEREGLRSRFRRSGSKFLSFLGLRDYGKHRFSPSSSCTVSGFELTGYQLPEKRPSRRLALQRRSPRERLQMLRPRRLRMITPKARPRL